MLSFACSELCTIFIGTCFAGFLFKKATLNYTVLCLRVMYSALNLSELRLLLYTEALIYCVIFAIYLDSSFTVYVRIVASNYCL